MISKGYRTILKDKVKILIINPFGIGDCLFTTPVINALANNYPDARISYWCNERVKVLFEVNPKIDKVFALSRGDLKKIFRKSWALGFKTFFKLILSIRREKFDLVLDYSLDQRYGLWSKLAGIKKRIGINYKNRGKFLTQKIDIDGYCGLHAVEYYAKLLQLLGISAVDLKLELFLPGEYKNFVKDLFLKAGISKDDLVVGVAYAGGGSWGKQAGAKHWPAENFAKLSEKLVLQLNAKVILLGDSSEADIAQEIKAKNKNVFIDLTGVLSLLQLCAVISELDILVANDGGPLHIAVAAGTKTVSIFGPVDEKVYGPYPFSPQNKVIAKEFPCRPCYKNFCLPECLYDKRCLSAINVDEVYDNIRRLV